MDLVIAVDDPRIDDVRTLLDRHLAVAGEVTPPDHVPCRPSPNTWYARWTSPFVAKRTGGTSVTADILPRRSRGAPLSLTPVEARGT